MAKELIIRSFDENEVLAMYYFDVVVEGIWDGQPVSKKVRTIGTHATSALFAAVRDAQAFGWQEPVGTSAEIWDIAYAIWKNRVGCPLLSAAELEDFWAKDPNNPSLVAAWVGGKKTFLKSFDESELEQ